MRDSGGGSDDGGGGGRGAAGGKLLVGITNSAVITGLPKGHAELQSIYCRSSPSLIINPVTQKVLRVSIKHASFSLRHGVF